MDTTMKSEKILIVEDDGILATQLRLILNREGYDVLEPIATGEDAVEVAHTVRPDLILMDIQLAGEMDGITAAERIVSECDTAILFLTGFSQSSMVERAKQIGPYGYLLKPVSPKELVATVETVLYKYKLDLALKQEKKSLQQTGNELKKQVQDRAIDIIIANNLLRTEIEDRKRRERILEIGLELSDCARDHSLSQLVQKTIDAIELLTASSFGFFHFLDPETLTPTAQYWSTRTIQAGCLANTDQGHSFLDPKGLLIQCLRNKNPMIHRELDFQFHPNPWIPDGHPRLTQMLTVPIIRSHRIVAFLGVCNKRDLYGDHDVVSATSIANIAWDIILRKIAEDRQAQQEALLRLTINGISDPILVLAENGTILKINQAARKYYGLTDDAAVEGLYCYTVRGMVSPCPTCEKPFNTLIGFSGHYERSGMVKSNRIERIHVDTVRSDSGNVEATIIRISDITQIRLMDRQLIQREKLAALGVLVAGIAHEINNPNNFIVFNLPILQSYLEFLLEIADDHAARQPGFEVFGRSYADFRQDCFNLLKNITHGSERINQLITNLRNFVRERGSGSRRPVHLKELIDQALTICMGRIRKKVQHIEQDIPPNLPPIVTDPLAFEQILINLLINAADACDKPNARVQLRVFLHPDPKNEWGIEVEDNGCGMDEQTRRKIFEPFFTTKTVGEGTGLGLSITYRLVEELGGRIEVSSIKGEGSLFRICFPLLDSAMDQKPEASRYDANAVGR